MKSLIEKLELMPALVVHQSMSEFASVSYYYPINFPDIRVWALVWSEIGQERLGLPALRRSFSPNENNLIKEAIQGEIKQIS